MKDNNIFTEMFNMLLTQGSRLPIIYDWLSNNVWSEENYRFKNIRTYFEDGEKLVLKLEELILFSAGGVYDELASEANQQSNLLDELLIPKTALVIRSEEHTSELQSHSFISYAVFCLKKKITHPYSDLLLKDSTHLSLVHTMFHHNMP